MFPLFRRNVRQDTISTLYGTIVAQARLPCFYCEYAVPDEAFMVVELLPGVLRGRTGVVKYLPEFAEV